MFTIQCNPQLVAALRPAGLRVLLPRLLALIDALVQVIDSYYGSYHRVFGSQQCGKKEKPEKAVDRRHANNHDLVNASLLPFSDPFWTSSADIDSSSSSSGCYSSMLSPSAALQMRRWRWHARSNAMSRPAPLAAQTMRSLASKTSRWKNLPEQGGSGDACLRLCVFWFSVSCSGCSPGGGE